MNDAERALHVKGTFASEKSNHLAELERVALGR